MSTWAIVVIGLLFLIVLYNISARQIDAMAEEIWRREAEKIKQREAQAAAQAQSIHTDDAETQPSSTNTLSDDESPVGV
ncbi:MAG: hypothetical protein K8L97_18895 [Anaerolineae bacterium]|nr:hypothetical protein [Anaerolineae bacterium]